MWWKRFTRNGRREKRDSDLKAKADEKHAEIERENVVRGYEALADLYRKNLDSLYQKERDTVLRR